jgi:hypothetical protein
MSPPRPVAPYHFQADLIWSDCPFKKFCSATQPAPPPPDTSMYRNETNTNISATIGTDKCWVSGYYGYYDNSSSNVRYCVYSFQ